MELRCSRHIEAKEGKNLRSHSWPGGPTCPSPRQRRRAYRHNSEWILNPSPGKKERCFPGVVHSKKNSVILQQPDHCLSAYQHFPRGRDLETPKAVQGYEGKVPDLQLPLGAPRFAIGAAIYRSPKALWARNSQKVSKRCSRASRPGASKKCRKSPK